jgi:hypothetical protein
MEQNFSDKLSMTLLAMSIFIIVMPEAEVGSFESRNVLAQESVPNRNCGEVDA